VLAARSAANTDHQTPTSDLLTPNHAQFEPPAPLGALRNTCDFPKEFTKLAEIYFEKNDHVPSEPADLPAWLREPQVHPLQFCGTCWKQLNGDRCLPDMGDWNSLEVGEVPAIVQQLNRFELVLIQLVKVSALLVCSFSYPTARQEIDWQARSSLRWVARVAPCCDSTH